MDDIENTKGFIEWLKGYTYRCKTLQWKYFNQFYNRIEMKQIYNNLKT